MDSDRFSIRRSDLFFLLSCEIQLKRNCPGPGPSVLPVKSHPSHFKRACIGLFEQLLGKSEKRFVRTHWLQASRSCCDSLWVRTVLFVGKCEFRFRRFKKGSRALATRAKTHCLDQNRQSLGYIAHRSNHWANATNLTYKLLKQCGFYSLDAKKKLHCRNMLCEPICNSHFWRWARWWRYGSGQGWKLFVLS